MNIGDGRNRCKQFSNISPYVGYEFDENPTLSNNNTSIYIPTNCDPSKNVSLTKMRQNLFCLENPKNFEETKKGLYYFQPNHTYVVQNPDSKNAADRMSGFMLQELPKALRSNLTAELEENYKRKIRQNELLNQSDVTHYT